MNTENNCASGRATDINIPFIAELDEILSEDATIECFVLDAASLFHAIDTFKKPPHPIVLA